MVFRNHKAESRPSEVTTNSSSDLPLRDLLSLRDAISSQRPSEASSIISSTWRQLAFDESGENSGNPDASGDENQKPKDPATTPPPMFKPKVMSDLSWQAMVDIVTVS